MCKPLHPHSYTHARACVHTSTNHLTTCPIHTQVNTPPSCGASAEPPGAVPPATDVGEFAHLALPLQCAVCLSPRQERGMSQREIAGGTAMTTEWMGYAFQMVCSARGSRQCLYYICYLCYSEVARLRPCEFSTFLIMDDKERLGFQF